VQRSRKFIWGLPEGICKLDPNSERSYQNIKSTNWNQNYLKKKGFLASSKCKGAENLYGGYQTEFAGSTQNPDKIYGTSNQPIRTKIYPKKAYSVP
jgi:hypothetical protein